MTPPPPTYPRVSHLAPGRGTSDDDVLSEGDRQRLLTQEVAVEEKLDGANVVLWVDDQVLQCSLRSGPDGADRAGQLGPLRAWMAERTDPLRALLAADDLTLYAEWLLLTHTTPYDRLPSYLIALDLRRPDGTFLTVDERNRRCDAHDVAHPPERWRGVPSTVEGVESHQVHPTWAPTWRRAWWSGPWPTGPSRVWPRCGGPASPRSTTRSGRAVAPATSWPTLTPPGTDRPRSAPDAVARRDSRARQPRPASLAQKMSKSAALSDPDTVCQLHLGLAQGVAESVGGIVVDELVPKDPRRAQCRLRCRVTD